MKVKPMFPFRRGKRRPKGGRRNREGGRRLPQSPAELLPLIQPATKALAQVLAGNVKASGQIVHARNILAQAERLVSERAVDRLSPAHREEFFEQLARLKLTVADAEAMLSEESAAAEASATPAAEEARPVSAEKLRQLALSLAASTSTPAANGGVDRGTREPAGEGAAVTDAAVAPVETAPRPRRAGAARDRLHLRIGTAQADKPERASDSDA